MNLMLRPPLSVCRLQAISPLLYQLAVYNLGAYNIFCYAQDPTPFVPAPPPAPQNKSRILTALLLLLTQMATYGFL